MRLRLHSRKCWVILVLLLHHHEVLSVKFEDNGYDDLLVAIHRDVPENRDIITQLTKMLESASEYLYTTTRKYLYIRNVTILVPDTWTPDPAWKQESEITFSEADIRVDSPHPAQAYDGRSVKIALDLRTRFQFDLLAKTVNNTPYTLNPGQCAEEGRYIHLTPDFVLDNGIDREGTFGNAGRLLVHEFAHLRFGAFDEYGIPGSSKHPVLYTDDTGPGTVRPTACSHEITGTFVYAIKDRVCTREEMTSKPPSDGCSFQVTRGDNKATSSVTFAQYLEEVTEFCESKPDDEKLLHNADAPNLHKMCKGDGTWDVIRKHPDVKSSSPDVINNRAPNFQVAFRQTNVNGMRVCGRRLVLVLDTSKSMVEGNSTRYFRLRQIADRTIRDILPEGTEVGIVVFTERARIWSNMTFLTSPSDRDTLARGLPKYGFGYVWEFQGVGCIECFMNKFILRAKDCNAQLLQLNGRSAEKGRLFLITDGEEIKEPFVKRVMPNIIRQGIVVHTIAYSDSAADVLRLLSTRTGGQYSYFDESSTSAALDGAAESLLSDISLCREEDAIEIDRHAVLLTSTNTIYEREILIDSTIGNNTLFVFTLAKGAATEVTLNDPSGSIISTGSVYYSKDKTLNIVRYRIPLAQLGRWKYKLKRGSSLKGGESIVGVVKSHPRGSALPYRVETWKSSSSFDFSTGSGPVVYVHVHKGYAPVRRARVEGTVSRAGQEPFKLVLKDDGILPDNTASDGVYTNYLLGFRSNSRYSIEIMVKSVTGETVLLTKGNRLSGGALTVYPVPYQKEVLEPVESFSRTVSGGAIDITGYNSTLDQLDPGRITDLDTAIHDKVNLSVTLTWTSPGDDLNIGTVTRYDIRIAKSFEDLRINFLSGKLIETNDVLRGSLNPLPAGTQQTVVIRLPSNWLHGIYVVGLKAYDEANRSSGLSNLRSVTFKSRIIPQPPPTTTSGGRPYRTALWIGIGIGVKVLLQLWS